MGEYYKIRFLDKGNSCRVWLGRTRINYNPVFVECEEKTFTIAIEKQLLKSDILCEYLQDRCFELIPVLSTDIPERRLYTTEEDWYR